MRYIMWMARIALFYYIGNLYLVAPYKNSFDFVLSVVTVYFIPNFIYLFYRSVIQQYNELNSN
ncbi:hypothetical protein PM10SUCC1_08820 [Propionigenium maris DSM 9537]|uniref:Uncharacterized protein n=1 Tax=Propionigenium maris DSM 9537 TaxID=1123000 RepID=A0A9W6LME3_9FUSO|nr:hypothetical protein [Propionigenium maris]GLI55368.1 hypothetical protein PM10SUCC1_08820 [Propionigenium maris DSM 9537]